MFDYKWYLKDGYPAKDIEKHNKKVFTTFACGGGSTMGYKLAGYEVIAANDIDPQMAKVYKENHHPKHFFQCGIGDLLNKELPEELYNIDLLDGSPPCSTFSMAGSREKKWGSKHAFREGQAVQVLDDLFFQFINLVGKIKPKIVVAENVKGMLAGNAKGYLIEVKKQLENLGYVVQIFLLNGATMGLPQKRERVFVICRRKDLLLDNIKLDFNIKPILFGEINEGIVESYKDIEPASWKYYDICKEGNSIASVHPKGSFFSRVKLSNSKVANTLTAKCDVDIYNPSQRRVLTKNELSLIGSYPLDYNYINIKPGYLIGMSVPPVMMAQVSYQVYKQWLSKV